MRPKLPNLLSFFIYTPEMKLLPLLLLLLATIPSFVRASVLFTNPAAGAVIHFSAPVLVTWTENGVPPLMVQMIEYELHLCAGGQDITTMQQLAVLKQNEKFDDTNALSIKIDPTWGGSSLNNA
jgi:hypothetical protein